MPDDDRPDSYDVTVDHGDDASVDLPTEYNSPSNPAANTPPAGSLGPGGFAPEEDGTEIADLKNQVASNGSAAASANAARDAAFAELAEETESSDDPGDESTVEAPSAANVASTYVEGQGSLPIPGNPAAVAAGAVAEANESGSADEVFLEIRERKPPAIRNAWFAAIQDAVMEIMGLTWGSEYVYPDGRTEPILNSGGVPTPGSPAVRSAQGVASAVRKSIAPVSGITSKLTREASDQLRENARNIWQGITGRRAVWDNLEVHHRIPLEWSHIFGNADPNRVANLVGINGKVHTQVSNAWAAWKQSLGGRIPTQAEIMEQTLKIDELFKNHWVFPK